MAVSRQKVVICTVSVLLVCLASGAFFLAAIPNPLVVSDRTKGIATVCPVHGVKMERQKLEIIYGLVLWDGWFREEIAVAGSLDRFREIEREEFPFADRRPLGGCVLSPGCAKYAKVWICSRCEQQKLMWMKKAANQALQTTSVTRCEFEKVPVFDRQRRGV